MSDDAFTALRNSSAENMADSDRYYSTDNKGTKETAQVGTLMAMSPRRRSADVVAENIRLLLAYKNMEVGELATKSGLSLSGLRKVRAGKNTSLDTLDDLAMVFKIKPVQLFSEDILSEIQDDGTLMQMTMRLKSVYPSTSEEGRGMVSQALLVAEKLVPYKT